MGDLIFKSSGVTAIPEIVEWNSFNINDTYLVVCSDGCLSVNFEEPETCDLFVLSSIFGLNSTLQNTAKIQLAKTSGPICGVPEGTHLDYSP